MKPCQWLAILFCLVGPGVAGRGGEPASPFLCEASKSVQLHLEGPLGERVTDNIEQWILRAPDANPGMLEMFALRDRQPPPNLVPWAGEFVGKFLISAVQALRMSNRPELRELTGRVISELIASQAADGYLGPFPREIRLKGNWDLWGHYHCMLALLMWYDLTREESALQAARRSADLACRTFLNSSMRVFDAGSPEMNMAFIHSLGWLYELTRERRYLDLMREIEKDWERAGDYLRTGLSQIEFFQSPRPRWESLHDLEGLVELYAITGDPVYRTAFCRHWKSILRFDRRNTGGFSSGEQATGNPYAPTAIETCSTIAWSALTVDMLKLTSDSAVADELELSLYNAIVGAQHPSGRWWTYSTPMDGIREASAHSIVFQARAGTPELNCCSVNGPRGLGMVSDWAVMNTSDGLAINFYGPGRYQGKLSDQTPIALQWETVYPMNGQVQIRVEPLAPRRFNLKLRIPAWSRSTVVRLNRAVVTNAIAGNYLEINRRWSGSDRISIEFDMSLRCLAGDRETAGCVSLYRGPLLLAFDQAYNTNEYDSIPPLDLQRLVESKEVYLRAGEHTNRLSPWLLIDLPVDQGRTIRLCDFGSAGLKGTRYRSWLRASNGPPPQVVTRLPADGAVIALQDTLFAWTGPKPQSSATNIKEYELSVSADAPFEAPVIQIQGIQSNRYQLERSRLDQLRPGQRYFWKILAINAHGTTESIAPSSTFTIDPNLPVIEQEWVSGFSENLLVDLLQGKAEPVAGKLLTAAKLTPVADAQGEPNLAIQTDGLASKVVYQLETFPEEDYTLLLWARVNEIPSGRLGQLVSCWNAPLDDPLRICVDQGKLSARIESGQVYSTGGFPIQPEHWYHVAVVKAGSALRLYVDGILRGESIVPTYLRTSARALALGGNPKYPGNEFLAAGLAQLRFLSRPLSQSEIQSLRNDP